jgi:hypothetical protein
MILGVFFFSHSHIGYHSSSSIMMSFFFETVITFHYPLNLASFKVGHVPLTYFNINKENFMVHLTTYFSV